MTTLESQTLVHRRELLCTRLALAASAFVALAASGVLVGWRIDNETLKRFAIGSVVMLPATALTLLLAAVALAIRDNRLDQSCLEIVRSLGLRTGAGYGGNHAGAANRRIRASSEPAALRGCAQSLSVSPSRAHGGQQRGCIHAPRHWARLSRCAPSRSKTGERRGTRRRCGVGHCVGGVCVRRTSTLQLRSVRGDGRVDCVVPARHWHWRDRLETANRIGGSSDRRRRGRGIHAKDAADRSHGPLAAGPCMAHGTPPGTDQPRVWRRNFHRCHVRDLFSVPVS